jgi:SAM-dependent methyltransferase
MVSSVPWSWENAAENSRWLEPAEEVYYLADRWRAQGRTRLLDLGCGLGRHSIFFAQRGFSVDAFDLSDRGVAALAQAARERNVLVRTRVGDMLSLPYETCAFDCLIAYHVVFHTNRAGLEQVIAEIRRVLRPGAEALITFNSVRNASFMRQSNRILEPHTVVPTEGHEAGIPHHHVDESEIRDLLPAFELLRFNHLEEIWADHSSWHYFVLARRP